MYITLLLTTSESWPAFRHILWVTPFFVSFSLECSWLTSLLKLFPHSGSVSKQLQRDCFLYWIVRKFRSLNDWFVSKQQNFVLRPFPWFRETELRRLNSFYVSEQQNFALWPFPWFRETELRRLNGFRWTDHQRFALC